MPTDEWIPVPTELQWFYVGSGANRTKYTPYSDGTATWYVDPDPTPTTTTTPATTPAPPVTTTAPPSKPAFLSFFDVSEHQGPIDWHKVKASGIDGVYIRYNNGLKVDTRAVYNATMCRQLGIEFGFYCYWHPMFRADRQVRIVHDATKQYKATWMPMIDVEAHDDKTPSVIIFKLKVSVGVLTDAYNKPPPIYTASWFWDVRVKSAAFSQCPLIHARYAHYSLEKFRDPAHAIPLNPRDWPKYALAHSRPAPIIGWKDWDGWQFAGGYDSVGERYGMSSRDLDCNILKSSEYHRFRLP